MTGTRLDADGVERPFERIGFCAAAPASAEVFDLYYRDPSPPGPSSGSFAKAVASMALSALPSRSPAFLAPGSSTRRS